MKLPNKVRIMGVDWTIEHVTDSDLAERTKYAETIQGRQVIRIDMAYPPSRIKRTLVHEFIHSFADSLTDATNELSETQVRIVAVGLSQIFADNPWVLKYLAESRESGQRSK